MFHVFRFKLNYTMKNKSDMMKGELFGNNPGNEKRK